LGRRPDRIDPNYLSVSVKARVGMALKVARALDVAVARTAKT